MVAVAPEVELRSIASSDLVLHHVRLASSRIVTVSRGPGDTARPPAEP